MSLSTLNETAAQRLPERSVTKSNTTAVTESRWPAGTVLPAPARWPAGTVTESRYVVLDLDSTLVYARKADLNKYPTDDERNFWVKPVEMGFYRVTVRKHLDAFLDHLYTQGYKVIIWSAGDAAYVKDIISVIFKGRYIDYLFTREHLTDDLKVLAHISEVLPDFTLRNARLIDDNRSHSHHQMGSFIFIEPFIFKGDVPTTKEDDDALLTMGEEIDKSFA